MNIFVTGATGVIGRRVVPLLVAAGHRVTAVGRDSAKRAQLGRQGAWAVEVDIFDVAALRPALAGQDVIVNVATHMPASSSRMLLPGSWAQNDRVRRIGSANLVDAALAGGATRFIQESFAPVYPDRGDRWIEEETPIEPARYNQTVADAEASAERFTASGRAGIVLRFAEFYGPDARQSLDLIRLVRRGWAPIPGPAGSFLSSISHDDAATAVLAALGIPPGVYNVVDDEPLTHREYFDSLARPLGAAPPKLPPRWATRLLGSVGEMLSRSQRISNRKLRAAGGWKPNYPSVREGWPSVVAAIEHSSRTAAA